jgi:hypothetical protein
VGVATVACFLSCGHLLAMTFSLAAPGVMTAITLKRQMINI